MSLTSHPATVIVDNPATGAVTELNPARFIFVTARSGIKIGPSAGVAGTFAADGSYVTAGIITATSFVGDGSGLSGVESWNQFDTWLYSGG